MYQGEEEHELEEEEIRKAVLKMKFKKTAEMDGISMEAWRYAGKTVKEGLIRILQQILKKDNIPKEI